MIASFIQRNLDGTVGFMGDLWALTAASEQIGYPASNLFTLDLKQKWVSWGQRASQNWLELFSDSSTVNRYLAMFGILGVDRINPVNANVGLFTTNTYRMIVDSIYPIHDRLRPPVDTVSLTNLSGAASLLNGPIDPPSLVPVGWTSTKMTATNNAVNTVLIADFKNYNATERALRPTTQTIRIHYVHSVSVANPPALDFKLRYNSVITGSSIAPTSIERLSEGFIYTYTFSAASLPGLTGRLGIQVTGTSTGGTSTPIPIGVEWIADLNWNTATSWDSGDVDFERPQAVGIPNSDNITIPSGGVAYAYFEASDWVSRSNAAPIGLTTSFTMQPLGGFQSLAFFAGRIVAAEAITMDLNEVGGYNKRKNSDISTIRTRGGSLRGSRNPLHWDEHDFNVIIQAQSDITGRLDLFFETAGMRNPVVIIPDERDPSLAIYGILTRWEASDVGAQVGPGGNANDSEPYYSLLFSLIDATARTTQRG